MICKHTSVSMAIWMHVTSGHCITCHLHMYISSTHYSWVYVYYAAHYLQWSLHICPSYTHNADVIHVICILFTDHINNMCMYI